MSDKDKPAGTTPDAAGFPMGGAVVGPDDPRSDEPMTAEQTARLKQLCEKHDEAFDGNLTREQADARIAAMERG